MRVVLGLLLAACAAVCAPDAQASPPLEVYGRLPTLEQMELSPQGDLLAYVLTKGDDRYVVVKRLADHQTLRAVRVSSSKLRGLQWADNGTLIITASKAAAVTGLIGPKQEWFMLESLDVQTGKQRPLLDDQGEEGTSTMNVVYGPPEIRTINGETTAFSTGIDFPNGADAAEGQGVLGLFRTHVDDGVSKLIEPGSDRTADWLVDGQGRVAAESQYEQASGRWTLRVHTPDHGWIVSQSLITPLATPSLEGLGRTTDTALIRLNRDGKSVMQEVNLATGVWGPPLPDPYDDLIYDQTTHTLIGGVELDGDVRTTTFFDPQLEKAWSAVTKAFDGADVTLASWAADHRKLVVGVDGGGLGYGYALVDVSTGAADWLGDAYTGITADDELETRPISYKAADGLLIHGYLTLPKGKPEKNLPLIVMPHGGPEARDEPGFDWLSQALASRGYAVLRPNFRGSTGYGQDFTSAGYGQWGRKMQTDLSDGVRYLAGQGMIDPKRVCIFGWSYGGYAALAGATLDPGVYRCAADMAGPSDLRRMLAWEEDLQQSSKNLTLRYWDRFMGAKSPDDPALDAISPARLAAKVQIPILIAHGKDDTVVAYEQSRIMADALTRAGKPVTLVTLDGEDHWGSRSATRLQLLTAVVSFLEVNNPPN